MTNQLDLTIQTIDGTQVVSSLDFLNNCINPARVDAGQKEIPNRDFIKKVEDELDDLPACEKISRFGNTVKYYNLTHDQMMLVGMRESKAVRKAVLAKLKLLADKLIEQQQTINNLELMAKQNMLNHLTIDVEIDELTKKKTLTEIKYQMEVAKTLGKSFDINQYIANASLTSDETKHLASVKGMIGSTIKELGGIEKPYDTVSTLLAKHGSIIRPKVFNDYLEVLDVISQRTVTEYGKRWGFNFKSGKSIQPRWYEETFPELINMVNQETRK